MNSSSRPYPHTHNVEWGNGYPYQSPIPGQIPAGYGLEQSAAVTPSYFHAQNPDYPPADAYQNYPSANSPRNPPSTAYPGQYPPQQQYAQTQYPSSSHHPPRRTHSYTQPASPGAYSPSEQSPVYAQVAHNAPYPVGYPQAQVAVPAYNQPEMETSSYRPYSCEICALSFARQHDLKRHRETHKGEKPFPCNGGCGKAFTRKDALKRHQIVKNCGTMIEDN